MSNASADYDTWVGTSSSDWNTAANWHELFSNSAATPATGDNVLFSGQTPNTTVTFSLAGNQPFDILFSANGYGYTLGGSNTNGLKFADSRPIFVQSSLAANNTTETIAAPIEALGIFVLGNFSPESAGTNIRGVGGYGNLLLVTGNITMDAAKNLTIEGNGDVTISGNILSSAGSAILEDSMGKLTLSGTNTFTGGTAVGGKIVLDYTTNNTNKISSTATLTLGNNTNGGHLVMTGNASSASSQTVGAYSSARGANSIEVDGNSGATATLNLKAISLAAGGLTDFNTNAFGSILTTSTNFSTGSPSVNTNILGPWATFGQTYWATVSSGSIVGLTSDNGNTFNSKTSNYTVTSGGQTLNAASLGASEGANTVRFTSGGTLDLGGGTLTMATGGILVTKDVTANTAISDGTITAQNAQGVGFDIYNYGTGTLTVSASLTNTSIAKAGSGNVILSGNNSLVSNTQIDILSGTLTMGSANALGASTYVGAPPYGIGNNLVFGDGTATLDTNGFNVFLSALNSDVNMTPGNQAAAAGLNSQIVNSKAGTISTIRVAGTTNTTTANQAQTTGVNGTINLGQYYGGLNEAAGAILAIDIEKGTATGEVQLDLGTPNPFGDPTGGNATAASGLSGANDVFTGAVTVGAGANLGFEGYSGYETTGVLTLNGLMGQKSNQLGFFAVGYLTGTGSFLSNNIMDLFVDTRGTVADSFAGNFGTNGVPMTLEVAGSGTLSLANSAIFNTIFIYGTSTLILPAITDNTALNLYGESTTIVTGTTGTVGGGSLNAYNGKLIIAPSGSGAAVSVNSLGTNITMDGTAEVVLDKGSNTSLTYTMGSTGAAFTTGASAQDPTFIIGSAQGLAALGSTDKFIILSSSTTPLHLANGIWVPNNGGSFDVATYAQNDTPGGAYEATFLTYSGTGTASDTGFIAYNFGTAINSAFSTWGSTKEEDITTAEMLTGATSVFGLEIDKGGSLDLNGKVLTVGDSVAGLGYVILNGASITGTGSVTLATNTHFYADADNATISSLVTQNKDVVKDGPGTLFITSISNSSGRYTVNQGALDLGALNSGVGTYYLHGGVIQGNGNITRSLTTGVGGVIFNTNNDYTAALGGGFSARGGSLIVTLADTTGSTNLVWGVTSSFLQEGSVFNFGSLTSDSAVFFESNMDFGPTGNQNGLYSRVISVTANASDTGDPLAYADYAELDGILSSNSNPYAGLTKTGTGLLVLAPGLATGSNTYTGATTIAQGMIEIFDDTDLGTAPTAAYALNTSPGVSGNALTPGALEINGGAGLGIGGLLEGDVTLSSNRQILLASGSTGATAAIVDVAGGPSYGYYTTLSFGGIIADYVNEVGSLEKQGGGTFDYSGTAYNTGFFSVTNGTLLVSGSGSVNSASGITINNKSTDPNATAQFNYSSTVGLNKAVTFGAGGGVFAYNSAAAYTGASSMTITTKQTIGGAGNLSQTALTIGAGGTITPGNVSGQTGTAAVGALTTGAVALLSGGNYNFLIADATGAAGVGYSTINATSLDLSGLTTPFNLNLETLAGNVPGAPANFNASLDYDFVLFATGTPGGITPETVADLDSLILIHPEANNGATGFDPAPDHWYIYENGDDSELILHYSAVPEPSTWAMLLGGLGLLVFIRRLRSRTA